MLDLNKINKDWTIFLDRDGVINHEKPLDYIHTWDEFVFYDGVKEAIKIFAQKFLYIYVVTNQKGVGKGLTKPEDLFIIHRNMQAEIESEGGKINRIYFCSDLEESSPNRKPNPGMGLQAKKDFGDIDFTKSVIVGNTLGDMEFGRNLGIYTIFLPTTRPEISPKDSRIDMSFNSLLDFANAL